MTTNGMEIISPTSVSASSGSATITNEGTVTYTGDFITLNGIFSATYRNYLVIIMRRLENNTGLNLNLTSSGTASTTNQKYNRFWVRNTGFQDGYESSSTPYFDSGTANLYAANSRQSNVIHFFNPYTTEPTRAYGWFAAQYSSIVGPYGGATSFYKDDSTSYDGFRIYSAATHTGRITVYGMVD